jgi:hypothetical protein
MPDFIGRLVAAGPRAWAVLLVGFSAAFLLVATEFSTIQTVRVGESSCGATEASVRDICETTGSEQHHWALLLLGVVTLLLVFGAAIGRSRPAAVGLIVMGVTVLVIAFAIDHGSLDDTHGLEARYANVKPEAGGGYTLERIGGVLAIVAGGLALVLGETRGSASSRAREAEEAAKV